MTSTNGDTTMLTKMTKLFQKMPKIELHRHLEGSVRFSTLMELFPRERKMPTSVTSTEEDQDMASNKKYSKTTNAVPTPEQVKDHFCITEPIRDLTECMKKFEHTRLIFSSPQIVERIAFEVVEDCALDGIPVIELRYSPNYIASNGQPGLTLQNVHASVMKGIRRAEEKYDVCVGLIGIIDRNSPIKECEAAADFVIANKKDFLALDLANDEVNFNALLFAHIFEKAKKAGLRITCHSGEVPDDRSPEWVKNAVTKLHAERIGHGIHIVRDQTIVDWAAKQKIVFEVCPRSNYLVNSVDSVKSHPIGKMVEAGLLVTLNTDDPGLFCTDMSSELAVAMLECKLTIEQIVQCNQNAFRASFIPEAKRSKLFKDEAVTEWLENVWKPAMSQPPRGHPAVVPGVNANA